MGALFILKGGLILANGDIVKLGTLYAGGSKQLRPTLPWRNDSDPGGAGSVGNIPNYSSGNIEIRDTDGSDAYKMQWIEVKVGSVTYLVADRVCLVRVSWDTLHSQSLIFGKTITIDGQQYKVRSMTGGSNYRGSDNYAGGTPTDNEWDRIITNEAGFSGLPTPNSTDLASGPNASQKAGVHNQKWNWYGVYSWCQEAYTSQTGRRAIRGYTSARVWDNRPSSNVYSNYGFRPVLEVLNTAPLISDSDRNLGSFAAPLVRSYSVSEADGDFFSILEKLDGTTIRSLTNQTSGTSYTIDLSSRWGTITKASHTLQVVATDSKGSASTRTWTFTKTGSPPNPPTITNPLNGRRVNDNFYVEFSVGSDPDGNDQTLSVEVANNAAFSSGKQTFTSSLQRFNTGTGQWENVSVAVSADAGKTFRIPVSGLTLYTTKYIRVGSIDLAGSNVRVYSGTIAVSTGSTLEFKTKAFKPEGYSPTGSFVIPLMQIASGATAQIRVCNNGYDSSPAWEDMTAEVLAGNPHTFTNTTKAAADWGIVIWVKVTAGTATGEISFSGYGLGVY